eukprot:scaffold99617_cov21-Tisochrysis_lutea.AAC.1
MARQGKGPCSGSTQHTEYAQHTRKHDPQYDPATLDQPPPPPTCKMAPWGRGPCARLYSSRTGPSRGTGLGGTVNMGWLALAAAAALSCTSLGGTSTRS